MHIYILDIYYVTHILDLDHRNIELLLQPFPGRLEDPLSLMHHAMA